MLIVAPGVVRTVGESGTIETEVPEGHCTLRYDYVRLSRGQTESVSFHENLRQLHRHLPTGCHHELCLVREDIGTLQQSEASGAESDDEGANYVELSHIPHDRLPEDVRECHLRPMTRNRSVERG